MVKTKENTNNVMCICFGAGRRKRWEQALKGEVPTNFLWSRRIKKKGLMFISLKHSNSPHWPLAALNYVRMVRLSWTDIQPSLFGRTKKIYGSKVAIAQPEQ